MKLQALPLKSLIIWEILSFTLIIILVLLTLLIFTPYTTLWYIILWCIGALAIFLCIFYCPLLYISYKFSMDEKYFLLKRGVLFNKTHIVNKDQISFVGITKTPFSYITKLSTLIIVAPRAKLIIPFMLTDRNIEIAKNLSNNTNLKI